MTQGSRLLTAYLGALAALPLGCSGSAAGQEPSWQQQSEMIRAPAKPGSSISHTRMCECTRCDPRSCCAGDVSDATTRSCGETHDFTVSEDCGMSVHSCASRCFQHIWRVPSTESCAKKRPAVCCER